MIMLGKGRIIAERQSALNQLRVNPKEKLG
jgi:hypothetical protein